jgi:hypothetical protein
VKLPIKSHPVGIVTLQGRTLSPAAQLFIQTVREVVRPLVGKDQPRAERRRPADRLD